MMESFSKTSLDEDVTEERFPLLLRLLEDSRRADFEERSRMRNIVCGATNIIGKWPCHLLSVVNLGILIAVILMITLLVMTAMSFFITRHGTIEPFWNASQPNIQSLGALGAQSCKTYIENDNSTHDEQFIATHMVGVHTLSNTTVESKNSYNSRSIYHHEQNSNLDRLFFIYIDGDDLTSQHACAIESSAKLNPNITCYIMILSNKTSKNTNMPTSNITKHILYSLAGSYSNIQILNVNGERYFSLTPLHDLWRNTDVKSPIIKFAARVITMWQYGGISYDLDLISLRSDSEFPLPNSDDIIAAELKHGLIIRVKQQCHEFLFDLMKVLATMADRLKEEKLLPISKIMAQTLLQFGHNGKITFNDSSMDVNYTCSGVKQVPEQFLCHTFQLRKNQQCLWTNGRVKRNSTQYKHSCPVSHKVT